MRHNLNPLLSTVFNVPLFNDSLTTNLLNHLNKTTHKVSEMNSRKSKNVFFFPVKQDLANK